MARSRDRTRATTRTFFVSASRLDLSDGSSSFIARFSISFSSISFHRDILVSLSISS